MRKLFSERGRFAAVDTPLLVDPGNQACVHAIHKIARGVKELAKPFVIVGPPDSGKTRILTEAGNLVARRGGTVLSGTARDFTSRLRDALRGKEIPKLIAMIEEADLLLVDEFHRVSTATKTREFLMARISARVDRNLPTIVATRHAPHDIREFPARDGSKLLGGFLLHVSRPGPALRRRYLTHLSKGSISTNQIERLCHATTGGLRELRQAWTESRGGGAGRAPRADAAALLTAAAKAFDVNLADLAGRKKNPSLLRAREAFVEAASRLGISRDDMRSALGNREPLALRRIQERARVKLGKDPSFALTLEALVRATRSAAVSMSTPQDSTQEAS